MQKILGMEKGKARSQSLYSASVRGGAGEILGRGQLSTINWPILGDILNLHLALNWMESLGRVGCWRTGGVV